MHHLFHRKVDRRPAIIAAVVFGLVFVVVGSVAMNYFINELVKGTSAPSVSATFPVAPTSGEYEVQAEAALRPFVTYLVSREAPVASGDQLVLKVVEGAQAKLLDLRVPAERRDAHFEAVVLLDAWRTYLNGGAGDYAALLRRTQKLTQDCPWLLLNVTP